MSNTEKLDNKEELEKLYQIYMRVQSGDKSALDELFKAKTVDDKTLYKADERYKERRMLNLDNVLDAELILENKKENDKNEQENKWLNSSNSIVDFAFPVLKKMLYNKKRRFLSKEKNIGHENGSHSKFYSGEYEITDIDSVVYHTILEIFTKKTDGNNCLTIDGKKNNDVPIGDGISLMKNISFFVSIRINKRQESIRLNVPAIGKWDEDEKELTFPLLDMYDFRAYVESDEYIGQHGTPSRLPLYEDCLAWLNRNDIHDLFRSDAKDIREIIETILRYPDVFKKEVWNAKKDISMRFVTQEDLQDIIRSRCGLNIKQENISQDLKIIEQRLLDHLFYFLNYRIGKAEASKGFFDKESQRYLYELDEKSYIKIGSSVSHEIYYGSIHFLKFKDFKNYFMLIERYEDMILEIISMEKGKKKYEMVNLIFEQYDLVEDKDKTMIDIADTIMKYYINKEREYREIDLNEYKIKSLNDWDKGYFDAEIDGDILKIRLFSSIYVKNPIRHSIDKDKLKIYCGYVNFYFCNLEDKICHMVPKNRRIISKSDKKHNVSVCHI